MQARSSRQRRKPKLGQNFLVDEDACRRIANALGDLQGRTAIEIGPGHGAITQILAERAARLVCVELDASLAAELRFRFRNHANVTVLQADILATDLSSLVPPGERACVAGNLPYYITSDILLHLCTHASAIQRAVVMMQREVADRVAAVPGTRDYGSLSITVQMHADAASLFTLPPEAFNPPPEVYSTVQRLEMRSRFAELGITDEAAFTALVRSAFAQKRKTLGNNLRSAGMSPQQVLQGCELAGISPAARAEALPLQAFAALFQALRAQQSQYLS